VSERENVNYEVIIRIRTVLGNQTNANVEQFLEVAGQWNLVA
jgi:hypothetical protein